jgi:hypothetical protein
MTKDPCVSMRMKLESSDMVYAKSRPQQEWLISFGEYLRKDGRATQ